MIFTIGIICLYYVLFMANYGKFMAFAMKCYGICHFLLFLPSGVCKTGKYVK